VAAGAAAIEPPASAGQVRRFVLEHHPVRGFWTQLEQPWRELRGLQQHPAAVDRLLGEAVIASVLLAATLKFRGTLTLQLQGPGLVRLLVAQCTHDFGVRAIAHRRDPGAEPEQAPATCASARLPSFAQLVGAGQLTVTIEAEERGARYQGIVALQGASLAECLENYFANSEQLPTRIALAADPRRISGVLVQKTPDAQSQGEALALRSQQAWEDVQANLAAVGSATLQRADAEQVLRRTCGRHDGRLFAGNPVRFQCRCSLERVEGLLRALGAQEVQTVLTEQGSVSVTCDFCGRAWFDAVDVARLFADGAAAAPDSIN